jgi:hypothetical protein
MYKLILFGLMALTSCNSPNYNATFTGFDGSKCACCWGYEITLDNGDTVKADKFPESLNDVSTRKYPFNATIEFKKSNNCVNIIEIESFEEVPN